MTERELDEGGRERREQIEHLSDSRGLADNKSVCIT